MEKGRRLGISDSMINLIEIRTNLRQIAEEMEPNSPSMREVREAREKADRRLAEKGITL